MKIPTSLKRDYKICSNCVMDTSDSKIKFDKNGVCDHCENFKKNDLKNWEPNERGSLYLERKIKKIRSTKGKNGYDSILGLSGGCDSSFMLHKVVNDYGLRPLVFHVDCGWNTQEAVNNIENMVNKLNLELFTEVINWRQMSSLQLAYFKSGISGIDVPQDHANLSVLYHFANKYNIKYILNGQNVSTECVRNPLEWIYFGTDMSQFWDIQKKFGTMKLSKYPVSNIYYHRIYLRFIKNIKLFKPLNYLGYIKKNAQQMLIKEYGWMPLREKHYESRFTRFFEGYWLPTRFGFDTRRVQYSSLILTKQMTRDEAIEKLKTLSLSEDEIKKEFKYVANKLNITIDELRSYHEMPLKFYYNYKNEYPIFRLGSWILQKLKMENSVKR